MNGRKLTKAIELVRLAGCQPAICIFLSHQISTNHLSISSIFLSQQISTSHQPTKQADNLNTNNCPPGK
jgi:hypothetical protein